MVFTRTTRTVDRGDDNDGSQAATVVLLEATYPRDTGVALSITLTHEGVVRWHSETARHLLSEGHDSCHLVVALKQPGKAAGGSDVTFFAKVPVRHVSGGSAALGPIGKIFHAHGDTCTVYMEPDPFLHLAGEFGPLVPSHARGGGGGTPRREPDFHA